MVGRVKFQVWSEALKRWRTAYVKVELLMQNIKAFTGLGYTVRADTLTYRPTVYRLNVQEKCA